MSTWFERGARNELKITVLGQRIIEQAQKVLDQADMVKQLAKSHQDPLSEPLRLGAILHHRTLPVTRFDTTHPQTRTPQMPLLIEENFTAVLSEQLKQGKGRCQSLLLYRLTSQALSRRQFMMSPLWSRRLKNIPGVIEKLIPANDLANESLLLLGPGHCFRDQVLQNCPDCQTSGNLQLSLAGGSLETIRHMVAIRRGALRYCLPALTAPLKKTIFYLPFHLKNRHQCVE